MFLAFLTVTPVPAIEGEPLIITCRGPFANSIRLLVGRTVFIGEFVNATTVRFEFPRAPLFFNGEVARCTLSEFVSNSVVLQIVRASELDRNQHA